ncbi:MAG: hypothetical protein IKQ99_02855, partial [Alphaproteobacteria bacterium]|nr:hypothetical protein [Alphaproteobacteria bacterium]
MREKSQQTGRSLLETLAVLVIIAILTIAGLLGYSFILRKHQDKQTVKQVAEVGIRYGLNRVKPRHDKKVLLKNVYPEAEREDAVTMITANHGRVSVSANYTDSYQVEVNNITDNSCREILASGAFDSLLYDVGAGKQIAIGSEYLNGKKLDGNEQKRLSKMAGKTKEQIIDEVCNEQRTGTHFMALIWGGNCPKSTASYHYDGKCWFCPEGTTEDKHHNCCKESELNECGVCKCPDKTYCDAGDPEKHTNTCVECLEDAHCPGKACDLETHKCVDCIPHDIQPGGYSRGCEDEKDKLGKPWCSDKRICEECLDN